MKIWSGIKARRPFRACPRCHPEETYRSSRVLDIASELYISSWTMQRRLRDVGYSFQQALEEAGHQLARHYMSNPALELNETAYLLGYEDPNSFVRALLIWEGVRPAHWRGSQREKPHPRFFTDQVAD
jgi:AraC-like DNA-binding protein